MFCDDTYIASHLRDRTGHPTLCQQWHSGAGTNFAAFYLK
jgi:hypothetical protein